MKLPLTVAQTDKCLATYMGKNSQYLIHKAFLFGAILFRDFDVDVDMFQESVDALNLPTISMKGSAAPRSKIQGNIYTSNDSPPLEPIPMHHEMAQSNNPPAYIFFYCNLPSKSGGETPIMDSRVLIQYIKGKYPEEYRKLCNGIYYNRAMPKVTNPLSPIGRSWKDTFEVDTKEELELFLQKSNMRYKWITNDNIRVQTPLKKAISKDVRSGLDLFSNAIIAARMGWIDKLNDPSKSIQYSDGTYVDKEFVDDLNDFIDQEKVTFEWQQGDVLMIDNTITMHSRNPFTPPRKILATIRGNTAVPSTANFRLGSWDEFPRKHLGTWKLKDPYRSVKTAIHEGFCGIDCSPHYENQIEVGKAINDVLNSNYPIHRNDLFITSKLWNTEHANVRAACERTLHDLDLDYLDMYMIHFPISLKSNGKSSGWEYYDHGMRIERVSIHNIWKDMEKLIKDGLVKNIGICNFPVALINELLSSCNILPSVLQVEIHPENSQSNLIKYCQNNGIRVAAFSPFGSTGYDTRDKSILNDLTILQIAQKYKCHPSQIVLSWIESKGCSVITKTDSKQHMSMNLNSISLNVLDLKKIDLLNKNRRYHNPSEFTQNWNGFEPIFD